MSGRERPRGGGSWREDRAWQAGILSGSALGAAATVVGRQLERQAREGLIDWPAVERIAIGRLAAAPGALTEAELRVTEPAYAAAMDRIVPVLSRALAGWVRANTAAFASLMGKLERDLLDQVVPVGGGLTKATMALANRWITTRQLGFLLGFMGQRVLGQYDLALLSAESTPGRLLFVEENIRATAKGLGFVGGTTGGGTTGGITQEGLYKFSADVYATSNKADALIISCGGLKTLHLIVPLENEIKVPVVSSTPHGLWQGVRMLGLSGKSKGYGRVIEG